MPATAERNGMTPWHRYHIMERYGLLTIIVLGETLLAAAAALTHAAGDHFDIRFVHIALSALVITFLGDRGQRIRNGISDRRAGPAKYPTVGTNNSCGSVSGKNQAQRSHLSGSSR